MHVVYIIQNTKTLDLYIGVTKDLKKRLVRHNTNQVTSTKFRSGTWVCIYAEAYRSREDAYTRELKLKDHGSAKQGLKKRIPNCFLENQK